MKSEQEVVKYWLTASKEDFDSAEILCQNKKYHHALFFCHLSIEKILKAIIVRSTEAAPPLIHDLVRLAERAGLDLSELQKNELAEITTFNIGARYDDYKLSFRKKAKKQFSVEYLEKTREILEWLNKHI
ncbi:MAG: DNA-binding protein [Planctomycetes bacterium B3_Pla]|nr:MAG: DNA-binding protein [Planctomycetes bacterium B3_Pla]